MSKYYACLKIRSQLIAVKSPYCCRCKSSKCKSGRAEKSTGLTSMYRYDSSEGLLFSAARTSFQSHVVFNKTTTFSFYSKHAGCEIRARTCANYARRTSPFDVFSRIIMNQNNFVFVEVANRDQSWDCFFELGSLRSRDQRDRNGNPREEYLRIDQYKSINIYKYVGMLCFL